MANLAFIGLGNMGLGMARRLLATGHHLTVYNRTTSKADSMAREGAQVGATAREACDGADAIFAMTADDRSSRSVWLGPDGILEAKLAAGALAIECSTLSHAWVLELAAAAGARGLRYLDAPVTGLPEAAAAGKLTLLVGAEPRDLDAARPVFAPIAERVLHFGPVGAGTVCKLVVNLIGAVQIASAAEGMAIAERAGLDLSAVAAAIATGQAASPQVVRNTRRMADNDHERNVVFTPALRLKDVEYAIELARSVGIGSPFGSLAQTLFKRLCDLGLAQSNESRIIEIARAVPVQSRDP
ncbi:MAG: NAD(P)-dependent oxidoreductase [Steroidobacterales bacterium]